MLRMQRKTVRLVIMYNIYKSKQGGGRICNQMVVVVATVGVEVGAAVRMDLVGTVGVIAAFLHVPFEVFF